MFAPCCVNHIVPSGDDIIPIGFAPVFCIGIKLNLLDLVSKMTTLFPPELPIPPPSVIHSLPPAPEANFTGSDFSPGIKNSDQWRVFRSSFASFPDPPSATQIALSYFSKPTGFALGVGMLKTSKECPVRLNLPT